MMIRMRWAILLAAAALSSPAPAAPVSAKDRIFAAERAFARSMAERDLQAFASFLSEEAVFFGGTGAMHGRKQILATWAGYFAAAKAPFSWDPDQVEILDSGTLALSTGLVKDAEGKVIARFNSVWRLEAGNTWRVVFDKGSPAAPEEQK